MTIDPQRLAQVCRDMGPLVGPLPAGIDGAQLLWAISGNESSFGHDVVPRHEPAYDVGGRYATHAPMPDLLSRYGRNAACSFGPWQVMLCNAPGYAPGDLTDLETAAKASVAALNMLLRHFQPKTLNDIGSSYNAGHPCADPGYTDRLVVAYNTPMPMEQAI